MSLHKRFASIAIAVCALSFGSTSAASAAWEEKPTLMPSGGTEGVLWGVSCFSEKACTAVGQYFNGSIWGASGNEWNGEFWTTASVVKNPGDKNGDLRSVYCYTATRCWAVGAYGNSGAGNTLVENSNKGVWSHVTAPNPTGSAPELLGVSCKTEEEEQNCLAVGHHKNILGDYGIMAESWDSVQWKLQSPVENPGKQKNGVLWSVACTSHTSCRAVGGWGTEAGIGVAGEEFYNGKEWKASTVPEPAGATFGTLTSISCVSASSCIAVGNFKNSVGKTTVMAERWNGISWSLQEAREPTGAVSSELLSVSCPSSESCVAVGTYKNSAGTVRTLGERWNGKEWVLETTPNPPGSTASVWQGVSCTGPEECQAVGWYISSLGKRFPFGAHL